MRLTVYIETTILGHLTSRLPKDPIVVGQMLATRKWWDESRGFFELFSSELVRAESARGDSGAATERVEKIGGLKLLPITERARELAKALVAAHALPAKAEVDALHLAIAATGGMAYLLTWNCRHLANATLKTTIEVVCREQRTTAPIICTPVELSEVPP